MLPLNKEFPKLFTNFIVLGILLISLFLLFQQTYSTPLLSVMKTFAMMLGDINYHDAFLDPLLSSELPYPFLSYTVLIIFTLLIPILLMNLLVSKLLLNIQSGEARVCTVCVYIPLHSCDIQNLEMMCNIH